MPEVYLAHVALLHPWCGGVKSPPACDLLTAIMSSTLRSTSRMSLSEYLMHPRAHINASRAQTQAIIVGSGDMPTICRAHTVGSHLSRIISSCARSEATDASVANERGKGDCGHAHIQQQAGRKDLHATPKTLP
jgi:hypothetical protein